jgi:hypothetical protein
MRAWTRADESAKNCHANITGADGLACERALANPSAPAFRSQDFHTIDAPSTVVLFLILTDTPFIATAGT